MRILSFTGGGMRGFASVLLAAELERRLGRPLRNACDLLAGTSTGALIACALAEGIPASQLATFYTQDGPRIFSGGARWWLDRLVRSWHAGLSAPLYSSVPLEAALGRVFPVEHRFASLSAVLVVAHDATRVDPQVICSWDCNAELRTVQVLRYSTAAPVYFAGSDGYVDGGLAANDPTLCAVVQALHEGDPLESIRTVTFDCMARPGGLSAHEIETMGPAEWAPQIIPQVMGAQGRIARKQLERLLAGRAIRIEPLLPEMRLDDASAEALDGLESAAVRYVQSAIGTYALEAAQAILGDVDSAA